MGPFLLIPSWRGLRICTGWAGSAVGNKITETVVVNKLGPVSGQEERGHFLSWRALTTSPFRNRILASWDHDLLEERGDFSLRSFPPTSLPSVRIYTAPWFFGGGKRIFPLPPTTPLLSVRIYTVPSKTRVLNLRSGPLLSCIFWK